MRIGFVQASPPPQADFVSVLVDGTEQLRQDGYRTEHRDEHHDDGDILRRHRRGLPERLGSRPGQHRGRRRGRWTQAIAALRPASAPVMMQTQKAPAAHAALARNDRRAPVWVTSPGRRGLLDRAPDKTLDKHRDEGPDAGRR